MLLLLYEPDDWHMLGKHIHCTTLSCSHTNDCLSGNGHATLTNFEGVLRAEGYSNTNQQSRNLFGGWGSAYALIG